MRLCRPMLSPLLVALAVVLASSPALADGEGSVAHAPEQTRMMSVTISPLHLVLPVVEVTAEFKAHETVGLAALGGWGKMTQKNTTIGDIKYDVWEVGGQVRYYALGDFDHGLQVGAEVLYVNVTSEDIETASGTVSGVGDGVAVGPFLGYKVATDLGFTFDGQLGVARTGLGAEAQNEDTGYSESEESTDWGPLLNLNVGWSF
jgi:hypothetical protein